MKTPPSIAALLLAFILLALVEHLHAAGFPSPAGASPLRSLRGVKPGASSAAIRQALGQPDLVLPPAVWVYWNFHTDRAEAVRRGLDTMVIRFEDDRAVDARIVSGAQVRALLDAHSARVALGAPTPLATP
jgi:hypothetical protein